MIFLEGFSGILITDGYSGYNKVLDAEHSGRWAHKCRKWMDAMPEGADAKTCNAVQGYEFCNRLFELERQFEKLTAEEHLRQRKEKSSPIPEERWKYLDTIPARQVNRRTLPRFVRLERVLFGRGAERILTMRSEVMP